MMAGTSGEVNRVTMFKVTKEEDIPGILDIYKTLVNDAKKDGKPYIHYIKAGQAFEDQRSQGFNLAIISRYSSLADMKYYDDECEAHQKLKAAVKPKVHGVMMIYFEDAF